jgi:hypothetical protein
MSEILKIELYYSKKSTLLVRNSSEELLDDYRRAVGGSENTGVSILFGGHNLPPAIAPLAPLGTTPLL